MKTLTGLIGLFACVSLVLIAVGCGPKQLDSSDPSYKLNAMKNRPGAGGPAGSPPAGANTNAKQGASAQTSQ